jgi:hypothetical protein
MTPSRRVDIDVSSLQLPPAQTPIRIILSDSWKIIPQTILVSLSLLIFLALFSALMEFLLLDLTTVSWNLSELQKEFNIVTDLLKTNPDLVLTTDQLSVQKTYPIYLLIFRLFSMSLPQFTIIVLILFSCEKIFALSMKTGTFETNGIKYEHDLEHKVSWAHSFRAPVRDGKTLATSLVLIILGSILLTLGVLLLVITGIILMIFGLFAIHALIIDEQPGMEAVKGGRFYAKQNFTRILVVLILSISLPMIIVALTQTRLLTLLGFTEDIVLSWQNPATAQWGNVFLYRVVFQFSQIIFFFWFPTVYTVLFAYIRFEKVGALELTPKRSPTATIKTLKINAHQKHYMCEICSQKLPLSARKCIKCGQMYQVKRKKTNRNR